MTTIRLETNGENSFKAEPVGFLKGDLFGDYLKAVKSAGLFYSARVGSQIGTIDKLGVAIEALEKHNFEVSMNPELVNQFEDKAKEAQDEIEAAAINFKKAEESLAAHGFTFYNYQEHGVNWLLERGKKGGVIADDMGLGKTLQALMSVTDNAPVLVFCPAVVKGNWAEEVKKFRPEYKTAILQGRKSFRWPVPGEVVITNYDILHGEPKSFDEKRGHYTMEDDIGNPVEGTALLVDECHMLKNWKSRRAKRVQAIAQMVRRKNGKTVGMTGTPLVNRPNELFQILNIFGVAWEAFGSYDKFLSMFGGFRGSYGVEFHNEHIKTDQVVAALNKVMLHRRKADVLTDLPSKTYKIIPVDIKKSIFNKLDKIAASDKWAKWVEAAQETEATTDHLPGFEEISKIRATIAEALTPAAIQVAEQYEANDEPVIIFSAHRAPVDELAKREGWTAITGDTPPEERTEIVERFQRGEFKGLSATIKAAGVGITLTKASNAVFIDRAWTPADNLQAEDRIYRIGQEMPVTISIFQVNHAVMERVDEILMEKAEKISKTVTASARGADEKVSGLKKMTTSLGNAKVEELKLKTKSVKMETTEEIEAQKKVEHEKKWLPIGDDEDRQWAIDSANHLTDYDDDYCSERNFVGWNAFDSQAGRGILETFEENNGLTEKGWAALFRMLKKYHRQVGRKPSEA